MLQISIAFVYSEAFRMTSGALYHLVTTYLINPLCLEVVFLVVSATQTEIADLHVALFVHQNVARLEISVDDIRGVHVQSRL